MTQLLTWSFYDSTTGRFSGRTFAAPNDRDLNGNTRPGYAAIRGEYDPFRQRVDLATGEVIEDLSLGLERDRERRRNAILQQIAVLEQSQARPLRELVRDPANAEARRRLDEIDAQIAALRTSLGD